MPSYSFVDDEPTPEKKKSYSFVDDAPEPPKKGGFGQGVGNLVAGAVRGAGSIGATILAPIDIASDAMDGKGLSLESNRRRRAEMDVGLGFMGAETDSWMYKGGKLAGEIAGTAGAGGVLANGAARVGAAPSLVSSLASGGMRAGGATGAGGLGIRTLGGAATGAASAGLIDPESAGMGALLGGALPGAVKATGALGGKFVDGVNAGSKRLMQSAIKPTIAQLKSGDAKTAVEMLLKYGVNPTKGGVEKLRGLVDGLNDQISDKIASSGAQIDKSKVLGRLNGLRDDFSNQVTPTADLNTLRGAADDFANHPNFPGAQIPVQGAQALKQGTYRVLAKKYGQPGNADTEVQKALARGLKEEIAEAVPGIGALNAEESKLLATMGVAERRALIEMNKNPMGLAALAQSPASWAMFMADKSALFKSLAARSLNATAGGVRAGAPQLGNRLANPLLRNPFLLPATRGDGE